MFGQCQRWWAAQRLVFTGDDIAYNMYNGGRTTTIRSVTHKGWLEAGVHALQYKPRLARQRLGQRPVNPSFGRPIFSLDVQKYRQIPPNCIVGEPQTPSSPNNK